TISVQRGYDATEYVLNSFGGAGGQHACLVADALGIKTVLIHPLSGVLSAFGMGLAPLQATRTKSVLKGLDDEGLDALAGLRALLEDEVRQELLGQGVEGGAIAITAPAHLRYAGTDGSLPVPLALLHNLRALFEVAHRQRFGFISPEKDIEIEALEVEAQGGGEPIKEPELPKQPAAPPRPHASAKLFTGGNRHPPPGLLRSDGAPAARHPGPTLLL